MKLNKIMLLASVLCALASAKAYADNDELTLGKPEHGGSGCPQGSVAAALSPDSKALSILFDKYQANAGSGSENGAQVAYKNCTIAIPVHIPQGYSISVYAIDYRGYTYIPRGGSVRFTASYYFNDVRGPSQTKTFLGPLDKDYLLSSELGVESLVWSKCGADANLRINTGLVSKSNRAGDDVLASLDSVDVTAALEFQIKWKRCN